MKSIFLLGLLSTQAFAASITLPNETAMLPATSHPGYALALQKCLICHSADYVMMQPTFSLEKWQSITEKMRVKFKAPLSAEEARLIASYLKDAQQKGLIVDVSDTAKQ